ncbi:unnamed protein product [Didymodactylos carnosus]|uniref:Ankyrin repeat protein n=1 Tax=Didymodactylos carnosus TaxID=1234261 RepID=A0A814Y1B4_9BILA|nr:unnamed protein product [Didymodactylos carnosus]CAF3986918.1 unnamed protein product [Didymodactylos carnosus]
MWAATLGHLEITQLLLDHGADVNIQSSAFLGMEEGFIKKGTALTYAIINQDEKIVKILLEKGANPDIQDKYGNSALMQASQFNNENIIKLLLNHKANIYIKNKTGQTAKDIAQEMGHTQIVKLLS